MRRDDLRPDDYSATQDTAPSVFAPPPALSDEIVALRDPESQERYPLLSKKSLRLGTSNQCDLKLHDRTHTVSRFHAYLHFRDGQWHIQKNANSKNGLTIDGAIVQEAKLSPGARIGLGHLSLIAESTRLEALRELLSRHLGLSKNKTQAQTELVQSLRDAWTRELPILTLDCEDDPTFFARSLHRILYGLNEPFITCEPARKPHLDRRHGNVVDFEDALGKAHRGTVCIRSQHLPANFAAILEVVQREHRRTPLLIICGSPRRPGDLPQIATISIPSKADWERAGNHDQLDAIARGALMNATSALSPNARYRVLPEEVEWLLGKAATLSDLEKFALRLVALKHSTTVNQAAGRLGMARISLVQWIDSYGLPSALAKRFAQPRRGD